MSKHTASDREFGVLLCVCAASAAFYAAWKLNVALSVSLTLLTSVMVVMVVCCPNKFARLKHGWLCLGERLGSIVSPIVLALLYFIVLTPTALILRWFGRDALRLKRSTSSTYWIPRKPLERSQSDFFRQQY
jgi:hypothetical protein